MKDYEAVDLSTLCNAGLSILEDGGKAPLGDQLFQGLPFKIGNGGTGKCFLGFGKDICEDKIVIPIGKTAKRIIMAHRLLESDIQDGGMIGNHLADYIFQFEDGEEVVTPIRERFEIAYVKRWSPHAYLAKPSKGHQMLSRNSVIVGAEEMRMTEIGSQSAQNGYWLWDWKNPRSTKKIKSLTIYPKGQKFLVAGLCLSHLDEEPITRDTKKLVKITLPLKQDAARAGDLKVEVNRGVASYVYPLPEKDAQAFIDDIYRGWGEKDPLNSSKAYVEIVANPSGSCMVGWRIFT